MSCAVLRSGGLALTSYILYCEAVGLPAFSWPAGESRDLLAPPVGAAYRADSARTKNITFIMLTKEMTASTACLETSTKDERYHFMGQDEPRS